MLTGLAGLAGHCCTLSDSETGSLLLSHCTMIFRAIWDNREEFRRIVPGEFRSQQDDEDGRLVLRCSSHFSQLYERM